MRWIYLRSSFLFWFGCIWAAVGLSLAAVGAGQLLLADAGVTVIDATVVEKGRDTDADGVVRHWLRYSFADGNGEHAGLLGLDEPDWRLHEEGDTIAVARSPAGPARVLSSQEGPVAGWIFAGLGTLFGAAGIALGAFGWRRAGRRARIIAEGIVARGRVEAVDRNQQVRINGRNPQFFTFRYRDEIGRERTGRSPDLPARLEGRWAPGDEVRVVYDPLEPDAVEADVFELRAR